MNKPDNVSIVDWQIILKKYANNLDYVAQKLAQNYPIQYLIGDVNFYGYPIKVNENVLIPRFETELLVSKTLAYLKDLVNPQILDIGTGSGSIAITLKKEKTCVLTAIDISTKALNVAKDNASLNNVEIEFKKKDILKEDINGVYDLIISNPPYVKITEEVSSEIKYEPSKAIYAGSDGLIFYENIIKKSVNHLTKQGFLAFEIGATLALDITNIAKKYYPKSLVKVEKDLNNLDRYLFIFPNNE